MTTLQDHLILEGLEKYFGQLPAARGVSLAVGRSEIVALLGPSGSGKTTILRLVAGFEPPDSGRIRIEGEEVTRTPPEHRRFGMVFQHYALFPHMTVGENVAFGLKAQRIPPAEVARRVAESLAAVDLSGFEARRVTEISGGQQQRVALARALAPRPRVLLLDEPLSNLDPALRERTRRELKRIIRRAGITTLFVTHEQEEAFDLGERVAVLHQGRLEQVGTPEELYERPATRFVARFIGRSSALPATWEGGQPGSVRFPTGARWSAVEGEPLAAGAAAELLVRPESAAFRDGAEALPGEVLERRYLGARSLFLVRLDELGEIEVLAENDAARVGDRVRVALSASGPPPSAYGRRA